jgi:hypothetical protein
MPGEVLKNMRIWGFVKKTCLYSKYYDEFEELKISILWCLKDRWAKAMQRLEKLLI